MNMCSCSCRCNCTVAAVIASVIAGVVAAFLQIAGTITVTAAFLWVVFGIGVGFVAVSLIAAALAKRTEGTVCKCAALNALLLGALGAAIFALVLLGVGVVATSIVSALLVGVTVLSLVLTLSTAACLTRNLLGCSQTC